MSVSLANAIQLLNSGQRDQARQMCQLLCHSHPDHPDVIHLAGVIAAQDRQTEKAQELFEHALQLRTPWPEAHCNLAAVLRSRGEFAASAQQLQQALAEDRRYGRAYFFLSQIASYHDRQLLDQILQVLRSPPLSLAEQCLLHFSAGKICDDLECYDEAFYHYDLGNMARRAEFDVAHQLHWMDRLIEATSNVRWAADAAISPSPARPIFVVGMPRSGTSLVEQILASHPDVEGAGELPDIPSIAQAIGKHSPQSLDYPECLPGLDERVYFGFAQSYLQRLDQVATTAAQRVVDKNPGNFLHLALIHAMFPQATIIHCSRHPLSTCLSCYFQNFASQHDYAFHQTHLGFYYAQYDRLMKHWQQLFPQRILDLQYERLVSDPQQAVRELLDWCGLEWNQRCLVPHQTDRTVTTASAWEVRQPIYRTSIQRWRHYQLHLAPLRNALQQGGVHVPLDQPVGSWAECPRQR